MAVPTTSNKNETVTATTTGDFSDTGILVTTTPANDGYVGVSVNGVWYQVGDATDEDVDCFFSAGNPVIPQAIADVAAGSRLIWQGTQAGFELDNGDRVDLYYNVLQ